MEKDYLLKERPLRALLLFALPMIIGNLFQQFYTMADSMVVGRYVSENALAAVGASYSLTYEAVCFNCPSHISGGEPGPGFPGACFWTGVYGVLKDTGGHSGYDGRISQYLFYGTALSLYVQCAVLYVQCPGALPDSSVPDDLFFCF